MTSAPGVQRGPYFCYGRGSTDKSTFAPFQSRLPPAIAGFSVSDVAARDARQYTEESMSKAKSGDTVQVHYTGKLDDGTEFESSEGHQPLEFALGEGKVMPGIENAVEGMAVGDSKSVKVEPEEAYGRRHEQLVQEVPRAQLPDNMKPEVGMQLQAEGQDGKPIRLVVTDVSNEVVTVDANHPLAGHSLNFDLELVDIK